MVWSVIVLASRVVHATQLLVRDVGFGFTQSHILAIVPERSLNTGQAQEAQAKDLN